ncbi:eCIS core domain-containing protein [Enterovibrio norvegicus]|uniref:eCIS core domain-containing protein n=1 Tax=Enterovibrio norvegicus TaxID=188144 RepID=UPI0002DA4174|nr:DUF4157 domain-containing protein [Enterovibrio norvegicus]OEE60726.1 hypothetical protein A1OS_20190 [Enterovibrio norvegicus]PMI31785.1 hypothetical protein BCU47_14505 [Enterovibrio norvegicus]TKF17540.1 DUF4157 domain-containing protein [Enterovibrio norvegicus]TKF35740.1 DUF4157 domain-containing protein [Enterovibrio norvegicus]
MWTHAPRDAGKQVSLSGDEHQTRAFGQRSQVLSTPTSMFSSRQTKDVAPNALPFVQTKLSLSDPGDKYEREADRVADVVMGNAPASSESASITGGPEAISRVPESEMVAQRACKACEEEELMRDASSSSPTQHISDSAAAHIQSVSGGDPLPTSERQFFESRFGADFSQVRIHTDTRADTAARSIQAKAYTRGADIVFRKGDYDPHSFKGKKLLAHELTHVIQQGGASQHVHRSMAPTVSEHVPPTYQRSLIARTCTVGPGPFPGTGLTPPGDCGWSDYIPLRASVLSAKTLTNQLGGCTVTESCVSLALKIAAMSAEIAARLALDTTCFRGGDRGHRIQVCDKVNAMMRCFRFFGNSNCSPELVGAMATVVAAVTTAIEATAAALAVAVVIALIVAVIVAIIALIKVIAAAIAAAAITAAEAATLTAAAAAILLMLNTLQESLGSDDDDGA